MPTGETSRSNPWKVLGFFLLGGFLLFATSISLTVHWLAQNKGQTNKTGATARPHRFASLHLGGSASNGFPRAFITNAILAANERDLPGDDLFKEEVIPNLEIIIPRQGMSALERNPRKYVHANIREGNTLYTNVAIHLKGGPGSFRSLNDTPAFTVNFEKFEPGQTFHGLKKIHLNNSVQDRSFLEEKISRELFEAAGVPVPRGGNSKVTINGRELGMYVLIEGINKQFLKRYFSDAKGNVYDGHSGTDVTDDLPTNSGENPKDRSRLHALATAARQRDLNNRLTALEKTLDLDRFLSFIAMEAILWHWDGYTMNRNNFRIFHDRNSDRMVFLPQGLDQMLNKTRGTLFPQPAGLVARSVLEIPEVRRRYRERIAQLTTNVFRADAIRDRIIEVSGKISASLAETDAAAAEAHLDRAASFIRKVQQRASYLESQIHPAKPLEVNESGVAFLTDWQSKLDLGEAALVREQSLEGKTILQIATKEGCTASWRTTKVLSAGRYRFDARLKTEAVILDSNDPRAGAGLRISGHRVGQKNSGNHDWMPVSFEFEVREDQGDVELVCELRANRGTVWFDLNSLTLRKL
jgi:spore coat protein H